MAVRGDSTILQQNAIPSVASNFAGIEAAIKENHANWAGAQPTPRVPCGSCKRPARKKIERARLCVAYLALTDKPLSSAVFVIPNLPPGIMPSATFDIASSKNAHNTLSFVLQQIGSDWKVGGFYRKSFADCLPHDGNWFAERARRNSKPKGTLEMRGCTSCRRVICCLPFHS